MAYQEQDTENNQAIMNSIDEAVTALAGAKGTASDLRVTLLGGTTAVTTVTTVTTVSTVTNQAQIGGFLANTQIPAQTNLAAVLGSKIWVKNLDSTAAVQWVYSLRNTGTELHRVMVI